MRIILILNYDANLDEKRILSPHFLIDNNNNIYFNLKFSSIPSLISLWALYTASHILVSIV